MTGSSSTRAPACGCFPLLRKKHPQDRLLSPAPGAPASGDKAVAQSGPLPAKSELPAQAAPIAPAPKAIPVESSTPQSDSIPTATASPSPFSPPPVSRIPRSRQPTDETAAEFVPASTHIQSRMCNLSESEPMNITTTRIPTRSASAEETVAVIANATAEATAGIVIDVTKTPAPSVRPGPPTKIPTPPCSRCASQEVAIIELPPGDISQNDSSAAMDLQKLIQNLPFSISAPSSPTTTSSATGRPASPVTIVNISVNQFNYHLQPDGTWAPQRSTSAPHPTPPSGPIIVEMPTSKQLSRIPSRPMTPPGLPPTRIPSCPAPARTSSPSGPILPAKFVPAPPPPKRLTSGPQKLAITSS